MKTIPYLFSVVVIVLVPCLLGCEPPEDTENYLYRQRMRSFVEAISAYSKAHRENFIVVPQNGLELLAQDPEKDSPDMLVPETAYINAIDGVGCEDLFYGYNDDNKPTPQRVTDYLVAYLNVAEFNDVQGLVTDYCWKQSYVNHSFTANNALGFVSFAADHRELDIVPAYPLVPHNENAADCTSLSRAHNFLYLINPDGFESRQAYLETLASSRYDLLIIDYFHNGSALLPDEITGLKQKPQGGSRLVIAYMSIGEAEDYRYYWQPGWEQEAPAWLESENPYWPGNFVVHYWHPDWQGLIYGNADAYLDRILAAGFDGVYLDTIDSFEYFETLPS